MAREPGLHDELVLVDQPELGQRHGERHATRADALAGLLLERAHSLLEIAARVGRSADARRELAAAFQLEPSSFVIRSGQLQLWSAARQFQEALDAAQRILALDSTYALAQASLAITLTDIGRLDEAIVIFRRITAIPGVRPSELKGGMAYALARAGKMAEARAIIGELRRAVGGGVVASSAVAAAQFEVGDRDDALASLDAAVNRHDPWLTNYSRSTRFDKLRADPRGKALLESTERP